VIILNTIPASYNALVVVAWRELLCRNETGTCDTRKIIINDQGGLRGAVFPLGHPGKLCDSQHRNDVWGREIVI